MRASRGFLRGQAKERKKRERRQMGVEDNSVAKRTATEFEKEQKEEIEEK